MDGGGRVLRLPAAGARASRLNPPIGGHQESDRGTPDLEPDDRTIIRSTLPRHGKISSLLRWNDEDPPDAGEKYRNDVIFERWQHNRNPFIDHPEWVDDIYG
ncbi:endonuclease [Actinoplanes sp. HUAS TT8]|uniref:endonuclease n=1 Tax=Actinoplanes sp. HUAS TT8 TaxID=3447453 RepID=UPI003F520FB4